jgi:pteridine reductase
MIHAAGGLAVLAHPASSGTRQRLCGLASQGLDGVEVLHPSHTPEDMTRLDALADALSLVRSGGSDWHGAVDGARVLGAMRVPVTWLEAQDARLARRDAERVALAARSGDSVELRGRAALVTGAGRRLGREMALALAARGMRVAVHYAGSRVGAEEAVSRIVASGGEARAFQADLTAPDAPARLVTDVAGAFGALDVLVNSAAVMERTPVGEVTTAAWDAMFALNLRAPFFLAQAAAPHLRRARGAIVNLADLAGLETWPAYVPHGITKAGIIQMTRALARVLAPEIRVNAIAPGTVLLPEGWTERDAERLRATTPLARTGTPADVVHALLFLLEADYVTGDVVIVDGGRHVRT